MEQILYMYLGMGLVLLLLSIPLLQGKIKRNYWYGFRLPSVFRSEEVWLEVNRYGAKGLLASAVIFLIAAVGLYFWPGITLDVYALICALIFAVSLTVTIIRTMRYNRSLK